MRCAREDTLLKCMNDAKPPDLHILEQQASVCVQGVFPGASHSTGTAVQYYYMCVDGSDNRLGKFLFQIIEATRGGMPSRDGNRSPRDVGSWGSRAKDFVICAEAAPSWKEG